MPRSRFTPIFLVALTVLLCFSGSGSGSGQLLGEERQLIEVRLYHLKSAEKAAQFDAMMEEAALPVLQRHGLKDVGVFRPAEPKGEEAHLRVTVAAYESMTQLLKLRTAFASDPDFGQRAQDYLVQDKASPAYSRIESMLLYAFEGMPKLVVPGTKSKPPRLFELRTYESHSELKGHLKVQMFNQGEIELFEKVDLKAVFYGEAIAAANLPQLTYMVVYDNADAQKEAWRKFLTHPEWDRLKNIEQYKDTVSKIQRRMLMATDYSMIK